MRPVIMKGISRVLFIIKASLEKGLFAKKRLEPMWTMPIITKNRIETFLIFLKVSIGGIIQDVLEKWNLTCCSLLLYCVPAMNYILTQLRRVKFTKPAKLRR